MLFIFSVCCCPCRPVCHSVSLLTLLPCAFVLLPLLLLLLLPPGVDKEHNQLVVAIIDFIRTYTWDKQLETWVKSSGILGGAGKLHTHTL